MQRTKLIGMATLGLCVVCSDIAVQAQERDAENQQEGRRRGRGGFGRGFQGGFGGPFGARGGGQELLGLLRIEEVQKEINLRDEQQESVQAFGRELRAERPDFPENFRDLSDEEQAEFRKKMQELSAKQAKETKATLQGILDPEQYKRLIEIHIQNEGASALADEDVAAKLNLTDEQKTKIATTIEENREKMVEQMRGGFGESGGAGREGNFAEMRERMQTLRKEADERVVAHLTDEQKAAFAAMKGDAFEMPEPDFGRGRGGFGGGRRGGPGGRGERPDRPQRPE
jgi:hypothetical protein